MKTSILLAAISIVRPSVAFWRMECRGRSGLARIDPLMSYGETSQHLHAIHGSSGFSETATYNDLLAADCTSCAVTQDKSAYWTPAVFFKHDNGSYELVNQVGGMLAYYFLNEDPGGGNITAFPVGFRMIAGNNLRRNYTILGTETVTNALAADPSKSSWAALNQTSQYDLEQRALGFNCLNYAKTPEGSLTRHYLPDKSYLDANCADGIRMELMFPSCWNGVDLDSSDHRSHVAYPDLVIDGTCPTGFKTRLPGLFYETIWDTYAFHGVGGEFVISNGDIQGFGYHGDFMMGWPSAAFLQQAVDECTNMSGMIEDCPIFSIVAEDVQRSCTISTPASLATETVSGIIGTSLPGGVLIQYGPGEATGKNTVSTTVAVPTVSYSAGLSATGTYSPGNIFEVTTSTAAPVSAASGNANAAMPTTAAPATTAPPVNTAAVSTQYVTNGNIVSEIIWEEDVLTVTEEQDITITVTSTPTPKVKVREEAKAHLLRHLGLGLGRHGRPARR